MNCGIQIPSPGSIGLQLAKNFDVDGHERFS